MDRVRASLDLVQRSHGPDRVRCGYYQDTSQPGFLGGDQMGEALECPLGHLGGRPQGRDHPLVRPIVVSQQAEAIGSQAGGVEVLGADRGDDSSR